MQGFKFYRQARTKQGAGGVGVRGPEAWSPEQQENDNRTVEGLEKNSDQPHASQKAQTTHAYRVVKQTREFRRVL